MDLGTAGIIEAVKAAPGAKVIVNMAGGTDPMPGNYLGGIIQNYPAGPDHASSSRSPTGKPGGFQTMSFRGLGGFEFGQGTVPRRRAAKLDDIQYETCSGEIKYPTPADLPKQ